MRSINMEKHIACVCLIGLLITACRDSATPPPTADSTATARSVNKATSDALWTVSAMTAAARPIATPRPTYAPTLTPAPTATPLPDNVPAVYAHGAIPEAGFMRLGIGNWATSALSPDRRLYAIGTSAGVYIFDTSTMQQVWQQATRSRVEQIEWTNDSQWIMVRLFEWGNILVWDAQTGDLMYRLENNSEVASIQLSPGGSKLAVGLGSFSLDDLYNSINAVAIWDVNTGKRDVIWAEDNAGEPFGHPVVGIDWSPDGRLLAATTDYGMTTIFEVSTGKALHAVEQTTMHHSEVQFVRFSPDGSKIVTYTGISGPGDAPGGDKHAYVWDVASGALLFSPENESVVVQATWSPDGKLLMTRGAGQRDFNYTPIADVKIWDVETGVLRLKPDIGGYPAWSMDGQHIVFRQPGTPDAIWLDINSGQTETKPTEQNPGVEGAALIALTSGSAGLLATNTVSGAPLALLKTESVTLYGVWSPDGALFAMIPVVESTLPLTVWDIRTGEPVQTIAASDPLPSWIASREVDSDTRFCEHQPLAKDPTGRLSIAIKDELSRSEYRVSITTTLTVSDRESGAKRFSLVEKHSIVCSTTFSADGRYLAVGHTPPGRGAWDIQNTHTEDNYVTVWNLQTGTLVNKYLGHTGSVIQMTWSPDGTMLASVSWDGSVIIWRVPTG